LNEKVFRGRKLQTVMALDQRLYQTEQDKKENKDGEVEEKEVEDEVEDLKDEEDDEENGETEVEVEEKEHDDKSKNGKKNQSADPNKDKGIVFVKNVNYDVKADDFTEHFKNFDKIVWAKVK